MARKQTQDIPTITFNDVIAPSGTLFDLIRVQTHYSASQDAEHADRAGLPLVSSTGKPMIMVRVTTTIGGVRYTGTARCVPPEAKAVDEDKNGAVVTVRRARTA